MRNLIISARKTAFAKQGYKSDDQVSVFIVEQDPDWLVDQDPVTFNDPSKGMYHTSIGKQNGYHGDFPEQKGAFLKLLNLNRLTSELKTFPSASTALWRMAVKYGAPH